MAEHPPEDGRLTISPAAAKTAGPMEIPWHPGHIPPPGGSRMWEGRGPAGRHHVEATKTTAETAHREDRLLGTVRARGCAVRH